MAIGDIVEPNEAWRAFKKQKTGRAWDYVFRRLFYTGTPDITRTDFSPPVEIDTAEATAGHISNLDLRVDPDGTAHLLYLKTDLTPTLRDAFFPGRPIVTTLEHVEIAGGKVSRRTTLATGGEKARETPHYARFHVAEDGTPLGRRVRHRPPARRLVVRTRTASSRSAPAEDAGHARSPRRSRRRSPPSSPPPSAAAAGRRTCSTCSASVGTGRRCGMRVCG